MNVILWQSLSGTAFFCVFEFCTTAIGLTTGLLLQPAFKKEEAPTKRWGTTPRHCNLLRINHPHGINAAPKSTSL